jgi:hypothetical protein
LLKRLSKMSWLWQTVSLGILAEELFVEGQQHLSPDNSPECKELGGTGFPACAKNTMLFGAF